MLLSSPAVEKTIVGFCVSWIVVRDLAPEKIFETIGMKVSAKPADPLALHWSAPWSAYYSYRDLKNGWHVIEADNIDLISEKEPWLLKLSELAPTYAYHEEEHVMYSSGAGYENGKRIWYIEHNSERGLEDLITEGRLPACFDEIYSRRLGLLKSGADCGNTLMGVPVAVIQTFIGINCSHDCWPGEMGFPVYVPLEDA